jgi:hypothetical protein
VKNIKKYLRQDYKKIAKPLVAGKLLRAESILLLVSGVLLQVEERTY